MIRQCSLLLTLVCACTFGQTTAETVQDGNSSPAQLSPPALDPSFTFRDTNLTEIRDIELFPDGRILSGGSGKPWGTLQIVDRYGNPVRPYPQGSILAVANSVALDPLDWTYYAAGTPDYPNARPATRFGDYTLAWRDLRGVGATILVQPDRNVLIAGRLSFQNDANQFYGLVRMKRGGGIDPSFSFTNSASLEVTSALRLANGRILTAIRQTNNAAEPTYDLARWESDGRRDLAYSVSLPSGGRPSVIAKAPGTNGVVVALEQPTQGATNLETILLLLDEAGVPQAHQPFPQVSIGGRVNALAFEANTTLAVASLGWERLIIGGDFTSIDGTAAQNVAALSKEGTLVWAYSADEAPDGPVRALEVGPDGKLLIGGSFSNIVGVQARGLARLVPDAPAATYIFWGNTDFRVFEKEGRARLTLHRSGNTNDTLVLSFTVTPLAGASLQNLGAVPTDLVFLPGHDEITLELPVINDARTGNRKHFSLRVSTQNTNAFLTRASANLFILDDETPGTLDPSFVSAHSSAGSALAIQRDGKILIGDPYSANLVRLNSDGSVDPTFVTNGIPVRNGPTDLPHITQILPQDDGKIFVAGYFNTSSNAYGINHVARLNADGTLDPAFNPRLTSGHLNIRDGARIAQIRDGGLLIWPELSIRHESVFTSDQTLLRVDSEGQLQAAFSGIGIWSFFASVAVSEYGDSFFSGDWPPTRDKILKLRLDGQIDTNFVVTLTGSVSGSPAMKIVGDWLVLAGSFREVNGTAISNLARVDLKTGALDTNFHPQVAGEILWSLEERAGKLYIAGDFTQVNGRDRMGVARLNMDGTLDESWDPGLGPNGPVAKLLLQPDGKAVLSSYYATAVDGLLTPPIFRLEGDPVFPPASLEIRHENGQVTIVYNGARLQSSTDLQTWQDIHTGGGNFTSPTNDAHRFYRVAR